MNRDIEPWLILAAIPWAALAATWDVIVEWWYG